MMRGEGEWNKAQIVNTHIVYLGLLVATWIAWALHVNTEDAEQRQRKEVEQSTAAELVRTSHEAGRDCQIAAIDTTGVDVLVRERNVEESSLTHAYTALDELEHAEDENQTDYLVVLADALDMDMEDVTIDTEGDPNDPNLEEAFIQ